MKQLLAFGLLLLICCSELFSNDQPTPISLKDIDGRTWLVDSKGTPFFAHGITHASNKYAKLDYPNSQQHAKTSVSMPGDMAAHQSCAEICHFSKAGTTSCLSPTTGAMAV